MYPSPSRGIQATAKHWPCAKLQHNQLTLQATPPSPYDAMATLARPALFDMLQGALVCATCGVPLSATTLDAVPVHLSCGHTACSGCVNAVAVMDDIPCPVCRAIVQPNAVRNVSLGAFCDSVRVALCSHEGSTTGSLPPTDTASASDGNFDMAQGPLAQSAGGAVPSELLSHHVNCVSCEGVPLPATAYCQTCAAVVCNACKSTKHGHSTGCTVQELLATSVVDDTTVDLLRARSASLRASASMCTEFAQRAPALKRQLQTQAADSCAKLTVAVAELKATLDAVCADALAAAKLECRRREKALDAQADAAAVSAGQLALAAGVCESAANKPHAGDTLFALSCSGYATTLEHRYANGVEPCIPAAFEIPFDVAGVLDAINRHLVAPVDVRVQCTHFPCTLPALLCQYSWFHVCAGLGWRDGVCVDNHNRRTCQAGVLCAVQGPLLSSLFVHAIFTHRKRASSLL